MPHVLLENVILKILLKVWKERDENGWHYVAYCFSRKRQVKCQVLVCCCCVIIFDKSNLLII